MGYCRREREDMKFYRHHSSTCKKGQKAGRDYQGCECQVWVDDKRPGQLRIHKSMGTNSFDEARRRYEGISFVTAPAGAPAAWAPTGGNAVPVTPGTATGPAARPTQAEATQQV